MHFNTVLVLVCLQTHPLKHASFPEVSINWKTSGGEEVGVGGGGWVVLQCAYITLCSILSGLDCFFSPPNSEVESALKDISVGALQHSQTLLLITPSPSCQGGVWSSEITFIHPGAVWTLRVEWLGCLD